jgi:mono/diheme cytochrome c family protein
MRHLVVTIVLVLVLAATPAVLLAQGDDEFETFTSEDGLFSVAYPAGWLTSLDEESPFPGLIVVNSEALLERVEADEDPEAGDAGFLVLVVPVEFFGLLGVSVPEDSGPAEIVSVVAELFFEPEPAADGTISEDDIAEFGEPEEIELAEERIAGSVTVTSPKQDGLFLAFAPAEGLLVVVYAVAYAGEFTEEQAEVGRAIAASVIYEGSAEDLMAALMAGEVEEMMEGTPAADLDGAALVAERCSVCHTTDRIDAAVKDEAGWTATVDRMIGNGAQLNSAEREAVIAYLSSR